MSHRSTSQSIYMSEFAAPSIDPDLAIATFVIFVVLLLVLRKFAWGPILDGLAKRESGMANDIEAAAARRKEAEKTLEEYQTQLERAAGEVRALLDDAKKEAPHRQIRWDRSGRPAMPIQPPEPKSAPFWPARALT